MKKILILNGPNLNMVGIREPSVYGSETLESINAEIKEYASALDIECDFFQSNCEGAIIDKIHSVLKDYDGCVLNAGAYTHYSFAIRDAVSSVNKPFVEVHMSNVHSREEFRHTSVISAVCKGVIAGFGKQSYKLAIAALKDII
jgi:3-dehydroquinate dehydratase-2